MKIHLDEREIELYILDQDKYDDAKKNEFQKHLSDCNECMDKYNAIKSYYCYLYDNNAIEKKDELMAEKIFALNNDDYEKRHLLGHGSAVKIFEGNYEIIDSRNRSIIKRIKELIQIHPVRFSSGLAFVGIIIALLFYFQKPELKNINPTLAVIKDNVLTVYNGLGDLLWKQGVPGMHDYRTDQYYEDQKHYSNSRLLLLDDLDGDGINELLVAGNYSGKGFYAADTLYCLDPFGKIKWKYGCGGFIKFETPNWIHNSWFISNYFTVNTKSGKKLFVVAGTNYAPTKLFELNYKNGNIDQEFYNSGGITSIKLFDFDSDGFLDIIVGGINNAFSAAFMAVFKADNVSGFGFSTADYIPQRYQINSSIKYIVFPKTNYHYAVSLSHYNSVESFLVSNEENTITVYVQEAPGGIKENFAGILYNFDLNWNIKSVYPADNFIANYNRLLKAGKLIGILDSTYTKRLMDQINYLR